MAFDRPLEADRVDDLGLLSTFVRAPIVGPIMWILGKKLAENDRDEEQKENALSVVAAAAKVEDANEGSSSSSTIMKHNLHLTQARGSFPDIASSSISDIMNSTSLEDDRDNSNATNDNNNSSGKQTTSTSTDEEAKYNEAFNSFQSRKKSRKMSWSDESGQSLVEYCDLSQSSTNHNQNTPPSQSYLAPSSSKRPIKSAMRRSTGNNNNNINTNKNKSGKPTANRFHPSQCVPSGLSGGSIIMPSGGGLQQGAGRQQYHHQQQQQQQQPSNGNGYISPQYGWYISMTPPTPPHYPELPLSSTKASAGKRESQPQQQQQQHVLQPSQLNGKMYPPSQQQQQKQQHYILPMTNTGGKPVSQALGQYPPAPPRPVFTRSLKGVPNNTSGWPSVPL